MPISAKDKAVIFTGGAGEMGSSIARRLVDEGAKVVIADVADGSALADELSRTGDAVYVRTDVTSEESTAAMARAALDAYGRIDALVNNAGLFTAKPWDELTLADWRERFAVNVEGTFLAAKAVVPAMTEAGSGSIVNISASSSKAALPERPAYHASKGAINAMTRQLAVDYGKEDIRANTIIVGFIFTGSPQMSAILADPAKRAAFEKNIMVPRFGEPADIAAGVVYLASDESKYVTGTELTIDGGALCHQALPELDFEKLRTSDR
jgi:NAD(P)-dependent dehydrogenase (short-subunit alcohol dehydrogenase family)